MKKFRFYSLLSATTIPTVFVAVSCSESKTDQEKKDYIDQFNKKLGDYSHYANIPNINPEYLNKIQTKWKEQFKQTYSEFNKDWKKTAAWYKAKFAFIKSQAKSFDFEQYLKNFLNDLKKDEKTPPSLISAVEKIIPFTPKFLESFEVSDDAYTSFKNFEKLGVLNWNFTQEEKTELLKMIFNNVEELSPGLLVELGILKENKDDKEKSPEEENTENNPKTDNEESSTPTNSSNENSNTNETSPTA
ncbi:hypothetical protein [Mycoplasmopsis columbina]|uniref:hypothetical protein n=1 Tax=Mycoplasmopsis columbina TaxID=114881 RepID=UPI0004A7737C|nr:hypothetical protein [Mycoplasmopsis columbina]VEU77112.1 Uncharacterised protein [Mycoplasmopsis columbina]